MTNEQINCKERHNPVIKYLDNNLQEWNSISKIGGFKNKEFVIAIKEIIAVAQTHIKRS